MLMDMIHGEGSDLDLLPFPVSLGAPTLATVPIITIELDATIVPIRG
jgi:hypothetical protein